MKTIGEVAKDLDIDNARLRDWCRKGVVKHEMRHNTRYISEEEYETINKIKRFFDEAKKNGTRKTFEDLKSELFKNELMENHQENQKNELLVGSVREALADVPSKEELTTIISRTIENAMATELKDILEILAERLAEIPTKKELNDYFTQLQEQQKLSLEGMQQRENKEVEEIKLHLKEVASELEKERKEKENLTDQLHFMRKTQQEILDKLKEEESTKKRRFFGLF